MTDDSWKPDDWDDWSASDKAKVIADAVRIAEGA